MVLLTMSAAGGMNGFKSYGHAGNSGLHHYWPSSEPSVYQTAPPTTNRVAGMSSYYADTSAALQSHNLQYQASAAAAAAAMTASRASQYAQIKPEPPYGAPTVVSSMTASPTPSVSTTTPPTAAPPPSKKKATPTPEELKDNTYWDRRRKNNTSAKRSRESRRGKEQQTACRVVYLEQENLQLRTEVSLLRSEIDKLRCILYTH